MGATFASLDRLLNQRVQFQAVALFGRQINFPATYIQTDGHVIARSDMNTCAHSKEPNAFYALHWRRRAIESECHGTYVRVKVKCERVRETINK